jgi:transcriptional regulator with XRE-family HTH domain
MKSQHQAPTTFTGRAIAEIRAEMARQGWSQADLAEALDQRPAWIWRRLAGHVALSLDDIERIAAALDISMLQLTDPRPRHNVV